jgi:hypothetical protein
LASNNLGELVLPELGCWTEKYEQFDGDGKWQDVYTHTDGSKQIENPGKPEGIIALANAIPDMRAILSLNLLKNSIGVEQARALVTILKERSTLKSLCGNNGDETELDMSGKIKGAEDAIMLAAEIIDNGALSFLDISSNDICKKIPGPKKVDIKASEGDIVEFNGAQGALATWNIDNICFGFVPLSSIQAIATAITDMGAISSVNLLTNDIPIEQAKALASMLKEHPTLKSLCGNRGDETELDMSGKEMGAGDAIMLIPEIVDNGAISSVNLLKNFIDADQAHALVTTLKEHPTLKSLCGNMCNETELDISDKMVGARVGAADAIMLVPHIIDNAALSKLIFGGDKYTNGGLQITHEPAVLEVGMTEAGFSNKNLGAGGAIIIAAWISHKDMGALTSLDISENNLTKWGGGMSGKSLKWLAGLLI